MGMTGLLPTGFEGTDVHSKLAGSSFGTPAAVGRRIFTSWQHPHCAAVNHGQVQGSQSAVMLGAHD